ncbi:MAG: DUF1206 domain-containing protein [Pseudomonadota bacterium]|nr:DUF1206 domain-containing protein [Pseudomonadota bacterium]
MTSPSSLVRLLARMGYTARGLVYLVVGGLTLQAALDLEEPADTRDALQTLFAQSFGTPLLIGLAAGLVGYAVWRAVQSLLDVDNHGHDPRSLCIRAALLVSAALHLGLAWACIEIALQLGSGGSQPARQVARQVVDWPAGDWLLMGGGLAIFIAGAAHIYKGASGGFRDWFDASDRALLWIDPLSRFGLCARGLIFLVVGGFTIYAGQYVEPDAVRGMRGALQWIQARAFGRLWLGLFGVGLLAFGLYSMTEAWVRRVGLSPHKQ